MSATTALVLRKASVVSAILATLALPAIADRCFVRADLFTTILTAAFLALLWRYHCTGRGRLWLLPGLMVLWVTAAGDAGLDMSGIYNKTALYESTVRRASNAG